MVQTKVVIFGVKDLAQLAKFYLETDSPYQVVAFTVHQQYMPEPQEYLGLPVVPFETVEQIFPPSNHKFFSPLAGRGMSKFRQSIYLEAKFKGYKFVSYVSSKASIFNTDVGENCFILEDNTIQPFTKIGNNIVIWSGCHIGHHSYLHDHVFLTSHVVISGHCIIKSFSWFGVNCTIRDGLTIEEGSLIAMGACVTKNTEAWKMYVGLPAKVVENKTSMEANP
jgi:sugar O-acyltransferase (sialic acid O-acetyltransferase NeuD family)